MKKIGFVLSAPPKYSETFLINEFKLLNQLGYEIILFEGYSQGKNKTPYKTIKSLPVSIKGVFEITYIITTLLKLFTLRLFTCIKFIINEYKNGTGIIRILKRLWFNAHILNHNVDYLHFCFADVAIQKELVAKSIGAKMSVSLRGSDILIYPQKNKNCYNRLWKHVGKIHAVSNWIYENALNLNLPPQKPYQIIHDFVDSNSIQYNDSDINWPLKIITVGRLVQLKDHVFAIDVFDYLIQHGLDSQLFIVGDGPMRSNLENLIITKNLKNSIKICGKLTHEDVLKLMSDCDLYMHTSQSEGLNVSLLEAQASGLLTISLNVGSTNENIEDGKSGWIIHERNVKEVGDKIIEVARLTLKNRIEVKSYARKRIEKHFDITVIKNEWERFFIY